jgi:hypothetical protein
MIVKPIQNEKRYTLTDNGWVVSSIGDSPNGNVKGEIVPLRIPKGMDIEADSLKPLLEVDGIIIRIDDYYLVSQSTLDNIKASSNPHWDYEKNGEVLGKPIGKSIPIIEVNVSKLKESGEGQDLRTANAGVQSVEYIYETELEIGVPIGLIKQLNYTLKEAGLRPGDSFNLWDMSLGDNTLYSIEKLKIDSAQADGTLDKGKLDSFLVGIDERLKLLRADFNMIKNTFYNGVTPISKGTVKTVNRVATTEDTNESAPKQVVSKGTTLTNTTPQPISTVADTTQKVIDEKTTTVEKQLEEQRRELQSTQQRQTIAQQELQSQLNTQAQQQADLAKKYSAGSK